MINERKGRKGRKDTFSHLMYVLVFAVLAVFAFLFPNVSAQTPTQPSAPPSANAHAAKDLYLRYSSSACHRYDGQGAPGARLDTQPR